MSIPHAIGRQIFEVEAGSEDLGLSLQARLGDLNDRRLIPTIERILDEFDDPGRLVTIASLHVDLGSIAPDRFEEEAEARLANALRRALGEALGRLDGGPSAAGRSRTLGASRLELLEHYLVSGYLPSWADRLAGFSFEAFLSELAGSDPVGLIAVIRRAGRMLQVPERLALLLGEATLARLVGLLRPEHAGLILSYLANLRETHEADPILPLGESSYARLLWRLVLTYLVRDPGSQFNRKSFVRYLLEAMAEGEGLKYEEIVRTLQAGLMLVARRQPVQFSLLAVIRELARDLDQGLGTNQSRRLTPDLDDPRPPPPGVLDSDPGADPPGKVWVEDRTVRRLLAIASPDQANLLVRTIDEFDPVELAIVVRLLNPAFRLLPPGIPTSRRRAFLGHFLAAWEDRRARRPGGASGERSLHSSDLRFLLTLADAGHFHHASPIRLDRILSRMFGAARACSFIGPGNRAGRIPTDGSRLRHVPELGQSPWIAETLRDGSIIIPTRSREIARITGHDRDADPDEVLALLRAAMGNRASASILAGGAGSSRALASVPVEEAMARALDRSPVAVAGFLKGHLADSHRREDWAWHLPERALSSIVSAIEPRRHRELLDAAELMASAWSATVPTGHPSLVDRRAFWGFLLEYLDRSRRTIRSPGRLVAAFFECYATRFLAVSPGVADPATVGERLLDNASRLARVADSPELVAALRLQRAALLSPWKRLGSKIKGPSASRRPGSRPSQPSLSGSGRRATGEARRSVEFEPPRGERIYLENAGLVLTGPFLPHLFNALGMLIVDDEGRTRFRDKKAHSRAVHLLQHLADGSATPSAEHRLVLNKLLCGHSVAHPIGPGTGPTAKEIELCERLLTSLIAHWTKISGTSIAGLRETFLLREGRLELSQEGWRLRVQRKTLDVLVDNIPWSIAVVYHRWMPNPIYVTW